MDEYELRNLTQKYWEKGDHRNREPHLEWYINNLLPHELDWACKNPVDANQQRLPTHAKPCKLLVLLVGFSVEPLLQAIWAYEPENILLLLNKQYGDPADGGKRGADFGGMVKRLIENHLATKTSQICRPVVDWEVVDAGPVPVFQKLLEKVTATEGVVIDITGAKKSMVAGAFLYAAYANVDVSYVDFDDDAYDPEKGRPYGYACRIGHLSNPYHAFALRDWERVRELYRQYNFRAVREMLVGHDGKEGPGTILNTVQFYMPAMLEPARKLVRMSYCYELWDSGAFNEAKDKADAIAREGWNRVFPSAVTRLGGQWFAISGGTFTSGLTGFYDDTPEFRTYVYDELKRVERLIYLNEDYRSAFLRVAGINEVLMLARVVRLVADPADKASLLSPLQERTPEAKKVFEALCKPDGSTIEIGRGKFISFRDAPEISVSLPQTMNPWWQRTRHFRSSQGWDDFLIKRNELAHKYFTVPVDWAKDALNFVTYNFEDFLDHSVDSLGFCAEALRWSELCERCGLKDLLPPNLKEDK
jgi:hypothetical protein